MTEEGPGLWASTGPARAIQVCLVNAGGEGLAERAVANGGAGITELCDWSLARIAARAEAIAVAMEVPHGPVVEARLERGFRAHAINPNQLDRFCDRFTVASAKICYGASGEDKASSSL